MQNSRNGKESQPLVEEEEKAQTLIRGLLNGEGLEGISPGECGPWSEVIASLVEAGQAGGIKAVRRAFDALTRSVPGLTQLVCGDLPPSTSAKTQWTMDELLTTRFPDPQWAIPGLLPVGLSILAGRPKLGKSWLALQIAQAVGSGGMALGQKVDSGEVIYFALEDSPRRIQKRLAKQNCPLGLPVTFIFEKGEGLIGVARLIEIRSPRLLVIDTLSRILPAKLDQNNVGEVTSSLSILQGLALQKESALLLVDHHRKAVGEDHIDDLLGSTGKSAVADALLGLFRQRGQRIATLKVSGRDMEDQELALEWDGLLCCWQSLGGAEEVRKDTIKGEILNAIRDLVAVGEIPSTANIAAYMGRYKGSVSHRLADLLNQGKVIWKGVMILDLLFQSDISVRRVASTHGGEWAGPCPWCGGRDRFRVWPERGRYWCRGCERSGDAIQLLRDLENLSFREACERLGRNLTSEAVRFPLPRRETRPAAPSTAPPSLAWQSAARRFAPECARRLGEPAGAKALSWLKGRGLAEETVRAAGLGYNPEGRYDPPSTWGLPRDHKRIWLPRGIVVPWEIAGELWRVNIRRPAGDPKYIGPAGCAAALYRTDALRPDRPAILLEGELDALTVAQHAGDLVAAVATGSTGGSRRIQWIVRLALASTVLVVFDADEPGEKAARWWLERLGPSARRWRPFWEDANAMAQGGSDLRGWVIAGLAGGEWEARDSELPLQKNDSKTQVGSDPSPIAPKIPDNIPQNSSDLVELVAALRKEGVTLSVEDGGLWVTGELKPGMAAAIERHRFALIALLLKSGS